MKTVQDYLDLAIKIKDFNNDAELSKALKIPHQELSYIRNNERKINETTATKLALLLNIDPMEIITSANYWKGTEKNSVSLLLSTHVKISKPLRNIC